MNKHFFSRLAASNLRKNSSVTLPYWITCVVTTAVCYNIRSLSLNPGIDQMFGDSILRTMLSMGSRIAAIFALIFLFYTNSFLVRRRKKEFAVFQVLGMEKRHLVRVLAWETFYLLVSSLAVGMLLGMGLDKLLFLVIGRVLGAETIPMGFFVSSRAMIGTLELFCGIALLVFISTAVKIRNTSPIRLMQESSAGEKEPKANWFLALLGVVLTGAGYWIALATENPVQALPMFFLAVLLVIAGTYLLFTAGSVALLKALRRSKRFYYKPNHFISVSGLLYRMKQNAAGLASICILSTMVLIMLSGTGSMIVGTEDAIHQRHPYEFVVLQNEDSQMSDDQLLEEIRSLQTEMNMPVSREICYHYLVFPADKQGDTFQMNKTEKVVNPTIILCMPLSEYNEAMNTNHELEPDQLLVYSNRVRYESPTLTIQDRAYRVKEVISEVPGNNEIAMNVVTGYYLVLPDEEMDRVKQSCLAAMGQYAEQLRTFYGFDSGTSDEVQNAFCQALSERLYKELNFEGTLESRAESRASFRALYGGFFFIGIFLGMLFLLATVLIIYYKQITEGWEDRQRYQVMRKVGIDQQEVKRAIRSQILLVFFLPLAVAFCHVAAAFPMVVKLLSIMNLTNSSLYLMCTAVVCVVFALFYLTVYLLTAKTYYKITSK